MSSSNYRCNNQRYHLFTRYYLFTYLTKKCLEESSKDHWQDNDSSTCGSLGSTVGLSRDALIVDLCRSSGLAVEGVGQSLGESDGLISLGGLDLRRGLGDFSLGGSLGSLHLGGSLGSVSLGGLSSLLATFGADNRSDGGLGVRDDRGTSSVGGVNGTVGDKDGDNIILVLHGGSGLDGPCAWDLLLCGDQEVLVHLGQTVEVTVDLV